VNVRQVRVIGCLSLCLVAVGCDSRDSDSGRNRALLDIPASREWRPVDGTPRIAEPGTFLSFQSESPGFPAETLRARMETVKGVGTAVVLVWERERRAWRREAYRQRGTTLNWCALAEPEKPWITFDPPIPIVALPSRTGTAIGWTGRVRTGTQRMRATANSRTEDPETVELPGGRRVEAWPIRTTVTIEETGANPVSIHEVRWLVPGIGLVRRSRLENGQMIDVRLGKAGSEAGNR
jgi:hypothetical protein